MFELRKKIKDTASNWVFFVSARKPRTENRSVYSIHENLSTGLTPQSRKKAVNSDVLKHSHSYGASFNEMRAKKKRFLCDRL